MISMSTWSIKDEEGYYLPKMTNLKSFSKSPETSSSEALSEIRRGIWSMTQPTIKKPLLSFRHGREGSTLSWITSYSIWWQLWILELQGSATALMLSISVCKLCMPVNSSLNRCTLERKIYIGSSHTTYLTMCKVKLQTNMKLTLRQLSTWLILSSSKLILVALLKLMWQLYHSTIRVENTFMWL